jgi:hypothetical protein
VSLELLVFQRQDDATTVPTGHFKKRKREQVNLGLFLLSAKAYATVESSESQSLGAAYGKELIPIDGEVNGKVLYDKEPDQELGKVEGLAVIGVADFLTRGKTSGVKSAEGRIGGVDAVAVLGFESVRGAVRVVSDGATVEGEG